MSSRRRNRAPGEGSITERKDGRWQAAVTVPGSGKRKYVYGTTRVEVESKLGKLLHDIGQGIIPAGRQTVADFLNHYLENVVKPSRRPTTYRSYEQQVRLHLVPTIGRIELTKLTRQHVQALLRAKQQTGLSNRSVQMIHAVLRQALQEAVFSELVPRNAAKLVRPPSVDHREIRPLDEETVRLFLDSIRGDRLEALFVLAIATGMRQGELLGLRWSDVDLDVGVLTVRYQLQWHDQAFSFVPPKTKRSVRSIELPRAAITALRTHRDRQYFQRLRAGDEWKDLDLVFSTRTGSPIFSWNLYRDFKRRARQVGIDDTRFHDLRHTAATLMLANDISPRVVMDVLGHSQISLTLDTYGHVLPAGRREVARKMDAILMSRPSTGDGSDPDATDEANSEAT